MTGFLGDLRYVVAAGFLLALLLVGVYCKVQGFDGLVFALFLLRWLHVTAGVMWLGLLWYFNFVQIPVKSGLSGEQKQVISGHIEPVALFWFRWAAMAAFLLGILLALHNHYLVEAYTLDFSDGLEGWPLMPRALAAGIGMWLGTIMWFNVWFVVWPSQRRALNIGGGHPGLSASERAAAGRTAVRFSRINTILSIPMLFSMVAAGHLY